MCEGKKALRDVAEGQESCEGLAQQIWADWSPLFAELS